MKTDVIRVDPDEAPRAQLEKPARLIAEGKLVGFPTETVYGLGANADMPETMKRVAELRRSPEGRPYTIHVADLDAAHRQAPRLPPLAARLMNRYWPGPLTLVVPSSDGSLVGLRYPSHPVALTLIRLANVAVVAPSANYRGEPPAQTADEVLQHFDGRIEAVVDAGRCKFGQSSTVVRIDASGWKMMREGAIGTAMVKELDYTDILFVCTGNTCRSPMAAALLRQLLADRLGHEPMDLLYHGYKIHSAGTAGFHGGTAAMEARQAVSERGCSLGDHATRPITLKMLGEADHVFVMTRGHARTLEEWMPEARDRIRLLDPSGGNISDPFGSSVEVYRQCARKIHSFLETIVAVL